LKVFISASSFPKRVFFINHQNMNELGEYNILNAIERFDIITNDFLKLGKDEQVFHEKEAMLHNFKQELGLEDFDFEVQPKEWLIQQLDQKRKELSTPHETLFHQIKEIISARRLKQSDKKQLPDLLLRFRIGLQTCTRQFTSFFQQHGGFKMIQNCGRLPCFQFQSKK
jgi:hypothetical protein